MFECIILAGGSGERFGQKKQFVEYKGKPLWRHVYDKCVLAASEDIHVVGVDLPGGKTRQESVLCGLQNVKSNKVVILEAARPLVTIEQILTIAHFNSRSISFIAPSVETIIYRGNEYFDRNACQILQVPQAFCTNLLLDAHKKTSMTNATDDTILMAKVHGISPDLIPGGHNLFKVTYPLDLKIIEHIDENYSNNRR